MKKISRRTFIQSTTAALLAAQLPMLEGSPIQARNKFEDLRGNIGIFSSRGGTIAYLVNDDGIAFVDSQFPKSATICLQQIQKRSKKPIEYLINTHHHSDHTSGNSVFRPVAKKIVGHANVPKLQRMQAKAGGQGKPVVPDTTYDQSWKASVGNETVHLHHYGAAHTSGDSVVSFEKANIVHLGDLVFHHRHPYIDPPAGASMVNWIQVLEKAVVPHDNKTLFVFGHAAPGKPVTGNKADVKLFRDYLSAVVEQVQKGIARGSSKAEITDLELGGKFGDFAAGGEVMSLKNSLAKTYDELTKESGK